MYPSEVLHSEKKRNQKTQSCISLAWFRSKQTEISCSLDRNYAALTFVSEYNGRRIELGKTSRHYFSMQP